MDEVYVYTFGDMLNNQMCTLVIESGVNLYVMHPDCDGRGSVIAEFDAYYCLTCNRLGDIDGRWARDMDAAHG